ncbi:MAG: Pycsar system effector family protein [Bryobacteraceae bacterium]
MKAARAHEEPKSEQPAVSASPQDQRKEARDQLTLILSFFSRVDAKASALLAINTGMLAILASNAPPVGTMSVLSYVLAGITLAMIAASLWFLYRVAFPALDGGHESLIYFREIAKRTESNFIDAFTAQDEVPRVKDLLGQVWRNSCILAAKFDSLKRAFISAALAIIPWATAVGMFSSQHPGVRALITR